jgi:hypothetical protein
MPTHARVRAFLENVAKRQTPITYQELTKALQILPPHSIHRVTEALEHLMEEDAAADRPFIAALAISKARGGLPGARVLRQRPTSRPVRGRSGRSGRMVVSRRRAEPRLCSLGRFARQLTDTVRRNRCVPILVTRAPMFRTNPEAEAHRQHNRTQARAAAKAGGYLLDLGHALEHRSNAQDLSARI